MSLDSLYSYLKRGGFTSWPQDFQSVCFGQYIEGGAAAAVG